jgi:diketogulonate reductase-like aldo/keto reductase
MSMNSHKTIDPARVPKRILYNAQEIPAIGMGTFASENYSAGEVAAAVQEAVKLGYRHIDCAAVYGNEKEIGKALNELFEEGVVERKELWITSKLWNDKHGEEDVIPACKQSIEDLQVGYLDLYLTHWPFPNAHPPGADVESRDPTAQPYIHENYMKTWRQMEKLVDQGLVRNIGTSNHTIAKMTRLLHDARIKPVANQMELHPHFQQPELFRFLINNGIQPIGFSPLGSPKRPERDRTEKDTVDIEDPAIVQIAENHGIHPALVCLKWAVQRGQIPIPFSVKPEKLQSNLEAVTKDYLTDEEMTQIAGIDKNCRLIKGQVFLWKDDQTWEDLWDVNGMITPP